MASIDISEERGVRYLHFGSDLIQGAMRIARPWSLELGYTRAMMAPLLLNSDPRWPRRVLQIGLGAASLTRFLYRHRPRSRITVVEISPDVVTAAWQFFNMPDDLARLAIEIGDGHAYVESTRRRFDLILVDGFDARGRTGMLESAPFYCNCRARLSDGGMIAANLLGRRRTAGASVRRMRDAFDGRILELPSCDAGNLVVLAAAGRPIRMSAARLSAAAKALHAQTRLDLSSLVARLKRVGGGSALSL